MEKFTKETLTIMSKEELQEVILTLQLKLESAEKEIEDLKATAEIGKKYLEDLKTEAKRLINLVHKESPILKLIDSADIETLKGIIEEYSKQAKETYRASSEQSEETELTKERLMSMDYNRLVSLKEVFKK